MPLDGTTYDEIVAPPTQAPTNPTADLLRRARARIERPEHWCQGATTRFDGYLTTSYCMLGAIGSPRACGRGETWWDAVVTLEGVIGGGLVAIGRWNDAHGRTHAEVLAAFDRAIEIAEGRK
jgi:hypothetical protein